LAKPDFLAECGVANLRLASRLKFVAYWSILKSKFQKSVPQFLHIGT